MKINFLLISLFFYMRCIEAQEVVLVTYNILFNQKFDQNGADFRNYTGYLKVHEATSSDFYMIPDKTIQSTEQAIEVFQDTVWRVRANLESQELVFDDFFNEKFTSRWYSDSLFPMRWRIGSEEMLIDSVVCTRATCDFRGRKYVVWFSYNLSYPFGPWKLGGLPGLIVRAEDSERNLVISLKSLSGLSGKPTINPVHPESYTQYLKSGNELRRLMRLSVQTTDCVDCESTVKFHSWEKVFN